jgi:hypothetical protein
MVDFYKTRAQNAEHKLVEAQLLMHRMRAEVQNFDGKAKDLRDHITSLENQISLAKVVDKTKPKKTTDTK